MDESSPETSFARLYLQLCEQRDEIDAKILAIHHIEENKELAAGESCPACGQKVGRRTERKKDK